MFYERASRVAASRSRDGVEAARNFAKTRASCGGSNVPAAIAKSAAASLFARRRSRGRRDHTRVPAIKLRAAAYSLKRKRVPQPSRTTVCARYARGAFGAALPTGRELRRRGSGWRFCVPLSAGACCARRLASRLRRSAFRLGRGRSVVRRRSRGRSAVRRVLLRVPPGCLPVAPLVSPSFALARGALFFCAKEKPRGCAATQQIFNRRKSRRHLRQNRGGAQGDLLRRRVFSARHRQRQHGD